MLIGKRLLVADDSVAIQKVIDLTFTDEGMEVTAVGDGDQARNRLEELSPDIVLADCFMPGTDGYELCRIIRNTERFKQIPVMLLVGSFEPFDEAAARQAGASDVVTKPFQSIRDLVSRVGSLLSGKSEDAGAAGQYSTLGLETSEQSAAADPAYTQTTEPDLKVFVEAPSTESESMIDENVSVLVEAAPMPEHEAAERAGVSCATDTELQTADTRKLKRIDDQGFGADTEPGLYAQDDTIEIEPVMNVENKMEASLNVSNVTERPWNDAEMNALSQPEKSVEPETYGDALLDLGEFDNAATRAVDEDVVLDLDFGAPSPAIENWPESVVGTLPTGANANGSPDKNVSSTVAVAEVAPAEEGSQPEVSRWEVAPPPADTSASSSPVEGQTRAGVDLSPEAIDAIARRVVEQMSERVVREIAWEVVPDLAELLIRERLDKQK